MDAVLLACLSAVLFGVMSPLLRFGLRRLDDPELAAIAATGSALVVCALAAAAEGANDLAGAWPFAVSGLVAPGASQVFFMRAIRDAGPARTSVVVGAAPLVSVVIALLLLDEPLRAPLIVGAILIVLGGFLLLGERVRPEQFRFVGLAFGLVTTVLFSSRDNFIRWFSGHTHVAPLVAAAATALGGTVFLVCYLAATRPRAFALAPRAGLFVFAGMLIGLSYLALFEAYYRGRVTVVSPLVATESLWGVVFSALLVGRAELIGRHLVSGALLIVAGGALIGAFR